MSSHKLPRHQHSEEGPPTALASAYSDGDAGNARTKPFPTLCSTSGAVMERSWTENASSALCIRQKQHRDRIVRTSFTEPTTRKDEPRARDQRTSERGEQ